MKAIVYCRCGITNPKDGSYKDGAVCLDCGCVIDFNQCRCERPKSKIVYDDQSEPVEYCDRCWKVR